MGALDGIRILDFTQVILGPAATQTLADHGADVVKVERPGTGDLARAFGPFMEASGRRESTRALAMNRNKRSLAVDLKAPAGRELIYRLLPHFDVVASNFRPGVMESLGLGYDDLRARSPRIICAEGSGWGRHGPLADAGAPGHELLGQSFAGLTTKNAGPDGVPRQLPTTVADFIASQLLAQGILLALLARERTGEGQRVEVALLDGLLALQQWDEVSRLNLGQRDSGVPDHQHPLQATYRTADGFVVLVGWFRPDPLANVCRALGLPDYSQDPRFATLEQMALPEHAAQLRALIQARVQNRTTAEWLAALRAHDVLCGEALAPGEAYHHSQALANGMVQTVEHPWLGPIAVVGPPVKLSATPPAVRTAAPGVGADSREVLREGGFSDAEIDALIAQGVVVPSD